MKIFPLIGACATIAVAVFAFSRTLAPEPSSSSDPVARTDPADTTLVDVTLPASLSETAQMGQRAFEATCAACHGTNAAGRDGYGPPLVHRIYEPNHHADAAFVLAVQNGVRAHHWPFGNMPPQEGLTRADVMVITTYVRELQRANGIN